MARAIWSVLCERALIDARTRGLTLVDVTEEVAVEGPFPAGDPVPLRAPLELVSFWSRSSAGQPERGLTRFFVLAPTGETLVTAKEMVVDLTDEPRAQTIAVIDGFPIRGAGVYSFIVEFQLDGAAEWQPCADVPLEVKSV